MPYRLSCNEDGCYVVNSETGERKNKKRVPRKRAVKYMRALYHAEGGGEFDKKESEEMMEEFINDFVLSGLEKQAKERSLDEKLMRIRDGIREKLNTTSGNVIEPAYKEDYWIQYVYSDYAVAEKDGNFYRIDYSLDEDEKIVIGEVKEVEMAWNPKGSDQLMVFKESSGNYRWIMFSSNAYRDRDGEIVSLKALTRDVERADRDGDYGPLRWWHVGDPDPVQKSAGPGLDIGDCDFNAMHGKILIESGTFRDPEIGKIISGKAKDLQGSILFFHPADEPDDDGVFHNIHRAERSLLPRGKASNSLVSLLVNKKESEMEITKEKFVEFAKLVGEGKVKEALGLAELTEKDAEEMGFSWKGEDPEEETPEEEILSGEEPESEEEEIPGEKVPKEFQDQLLATLKETLDPVGTQLKEIAESQDHLLDSNSSMKEVIDGQSKKLASLEKRVKELEGEEPRSRKGYRPSQDEETIIEDDHQLKGEKPGIDPEFMTFLVPGNQE